MLVVMWCPFSGQYKGLHKAFNKPTLYKSHHAYIVQVASTLLHNSFLITLVCHYVNRIGFEVASHTVVVASLTGTSIST